MKNLVLKLAVLGLLIGPQSAHAVFIYAVDRTIGAGRVVGTITTDETLGRLMDSNISAVELMFTDDVDASGPGGEFWNIAGSSVFATELGLFFDFGGTVAAHFDKREGSELWWWEMSQGAEIFKHMGAVVHIDEQSRSGNVQIAARRSVPESSALSLLGLGLAGMTVIRIRQRRQAALV